MACTNCLMDDSDPKIEFNELGMCNHCSSFYARETKSAEEKEASFRKLISEIKQSKPKGKYHCIAGISGGTDSSFMMHKLINEGLNVLAVHIDAGWNANEAEVNLKSIMDKLGVDLYHYKVDWNAFKALQLSYIRSGVVDLELPTDHILFGALYDAAHKHKVQYIITGQNSATEYFMPKSWVFDKNDSVNLLNIHQKFGDGTSLKSLPILTPWKKFNYYNIRKIKLIFLLEHLEYNKAKAEEELHSTYGWKPYKTKHGESVWTRFYQCYILPTRFGIDKRKAHISNLIAGGQITRNEGIKLLEEPLYTTPFQEDKAYVLERFGLTEQEFDKLMKNPIRHHEDFATEKTVKQFYHKVRLFLKPLLTLNESPRY